MKLVSVNVNGIKAFEEKSGLYDLMEGFNPDLLCIQETKADRDKFDYYTSDYKDNYIRFHAESKYKKGYAGVGILLKKDYQDQVIGCEEVTLEDSYGSGRILKLELDKFNFIVVYTINSGEKDDLRKLWDIKFLEYIKGINSKPVIIMGDFNVVRNVLDFHGDLFEVVDELPSLKTYERQGFERLLKEADLRDSYRDLNPMSRQFSWFSYQGKAYDKGEGWRIDYALVSTSIMDKVESSLIHDKFRYSDHMPIELNIDYEGLTNPTLREVQE